MRVLVATLAVLCGSAAAAQPPKALGAAGGDRGAEEARVLAAVDALFVAMNKRDREAVLAAVDPDGLATSVRVDEEPKPRVRKWHWSTYVDGLVTNTQVETEQLRNPVVRVERDIAMVWAPYELLLDGKFDHCGVDHFDLVRQGGKWLVYNFTWTNQKKGCPGR